jgi:hypothetical protein
MLVGDGARAVDTLAAAIDALPHSEPELGLTLEATLTVSRLVQLAAHRPLDRRAACLRRDRTRSGAR